jgi:pyridoxine 5-phosphate synthase
MRAVVVMPVQPRLSMNLNKSALLRNSRRTGVPDVLRFATLARAASADGITVHPRPDERHIRRDDVLELAELMQPWRPAFELNVEGYPDARFLEIVRTVRPEQCTLVPDPPDAFTSEEGWKLNDRDMPLLRSAVAAVKDIGCRVILFMDPDPVAVARVAPPMRTESRSTRGPMPLPRAPGDPDHCSRPAPRPVAARWSSAWW